jgi:hypothetical protein
MKGGEQPFLLTLRLDDEAQRFYEGLRQQYFPPERNLIAAHVILFHQLPEEERARAVIREVAGRCAAMRLVRPELRSIGRGVAVFFEAEALGEVHRALSTAFAATLIAQDRQGLRPHIMVQNKVDPAVARETLAALQGGSLIEPLGVGLTLWRYLGGPWERVAEFDFGGVRGSVGSG